MRRERRIQFASRLRAVSVLDEAQPRFIVIEPRVTAGGEQEDQSQNGVHGQIVTNHAPGEPSKPFERRNQPCDVSSLPPPSSQPCRSSSPARIITTTTVTDYRC